MAGRSRGSYRMTPARRAALRKAQLASARKRRREGFKRGARVVGVVAAGLAVTAVNHQLNRAVTHPRAFAKDVRDAHGFVRGKLGGKDPSAPGPAPKLKAANFPKHRVTSTAHGRRTRSRVAGRLH